MAFVAPIARASSSAGEAAVTRVRDARGFAAALPRQPSELVVISFVQAGCRACRYAQRQFARVAALHDDTRFFELDIDSAPALCRDLGVANVPQFQLYTLPSQGSDVGVLDTVSGPSAVKQVSERIAQFYSDEFNIDDYEFAT